MKKTQTDLLQGTLDLLVLKTLQSGPTHGWDIAQRKPQISQDVLRVGQGSLYPAGGAGLDSRRTTGKKYYKLTAVGRKQSSAETERWRRLTCAVELILKTSCMKGYGHAQQTETAITGTFL